MILQPEQKLKHLRELKNYTQDYMASRMGLSTRAYSKIETGETQLTINRLNEISEILEVDPIQILGFDEKQIFNHCTQEGNIGINHISVSEQIMEQYKQQIELLREEVAFLREMVKKDK